ncbi:hypothetical protein [Phyllobacterium zundukense]|nr:hypothetical protein [Phyllobacterium zundukense]
MTSTKFVLYNQRLEGTYENKLGNAIEHHRSTRRKIDITIDALPDDSISESEMLWLDGDLENAVEDEEKARLAFLSYPVESLEDVRAKANHVRLLLAEGDELDKTELELLLLSMV